LVSRIKAWELFFHLGGLGPKEDLSKEVDPTIFHDVNKRLTNFMILVYSLDTFLGEAINKASAECDESKVEHLCPAAHSLRSILFGANGERDDIDTEEITVYKGCVFSKDEFTDI